MSIQIYSFYKISDAIYRPWIPVKIVNPLSGYSITALALLDTGADHCVFPKFVADNLKIDLKGEAKSSEIMQGLGENKIEVWKHDLVIEILTHDRKATYWKSKVEEIGCVDHDNIPPILGFSTCMSHFKITFNHYTKKIMLDDRPKV